ncbi:hypothetical protein DFH08DRAFT_987991 [Mycena albidolilacea]|uniref:AAA-ATPase-like domain-containing protein n=1 Tax=Mycena albidolilacea TaxID=1033008 RepID=A0AAD7AAJ7_9AGAR|nr:hypothetical protein DFH08DRAFT_987991 [Mycena albidolilacea]
MDSGFPLSCALADHDDIFETTSISYISHGFNLARSIQELHDARCRCGTLIGSVYTVEPDFSAKHGLSFKKEELRGESFSEIGAWDFVRDHFPRRPPTGIVSIVCYTGKDLPNPDRFLRPEGSPNSKRALDDEQSSSSDDSKKDTKRQKADSLSPISCDSESDSVASLPRLPNAYYNYRHMRRDPGYAWIDKSQTILRLPDRFRLLLLRPPRFGKTAFQTALDYYYDISGAQDFSQDFPTLSEFAANPDSLPRHNQHLCLSFPLSMLATECDWETFVSDADKFIELHEDDLLDGAELVRQSNRTLFISVDDYDKPSREYFFSCKDSDSPSLHDIETYIDSFFWGPLQKGDDVIEKLFVTGTFLLESPAFENLRLLDLKAAGELQYSCGFQEVEALKFAESFLGETPCIAELCQSCGEYRFSPPKADSERIEPVLHPQCFLTRVAELSHQEPLSGDDKSYDLLSTVLRQTPEKSDVPSALTVDGLINLVATGAIEMDGPLHAPLHSDGITLRWSVLYYLGAVTHDRQSPTTLRLTNSVVLSLIHSRIDSVLAVRHRLKDRLPHAISAGEADNDPKPLADLLTDVLRDQTGRTLGQQHEPDLFDGVSRVRVRDSANEWELRTLSLRGLWRAANPNDDAPSVEALRTLREEVMIEEEDALLARLHRPPSPSLGTAETVPVRSFLDAGTGMAFAAVGGGRILTRRRS